MTATANDDAAPAAATTASGGAGGTPVGHVLDVRRIVVPVDGSPFAERSLPVARWIGDELGAPLQLVEVISRTASCDDALRYVDALARRHVIPSWRVIQGDVVADVIVAATNHDGVGLACLATHGRDRSAMVLGSVAAALLDRTTEPVMLVGPQARPPCAADAPVVAAVDGGAADGAVVDVAVGWATALGRRLVIATVVEPAPAPYRQGRRRPRARGPADPEGHLSDLAQRAAVAAPACDVTTRVAYDPINVRDGLIRILDRTAALVVLGSHRHAVPIRLLLGRHAARIVHDAEVPAVVVPLDAGSRGLTG
jgi:nucleotide-binding universal stress UspA family protein